MTLHKVKRPMPFAADAMTIGFAAFTGTLRKRSAQKPPAGGELGNAGTETAFGSGEFGAMKMAIHVLYS